MSVVTLGSVLTSLESGARPKGGASAEGDGIPSVGGEHLDANGGFRFENIKLIPEGFFNGMAQGRIAVDDILVVKDGATTGKTSFVGPDFPYPVAAVNEHVFVVRVDSSKAWPRYAFHYLHSAVGQADIRKDFRGATVGGISRGFVDVVRFPLPPLPVQKRIAAILDAADALRAKRRESIEQLDSLIQSTFLEMFGDPVTNPKGWDTVDLLSLCDTRRGISYGVVQRGENAPQGVPLIRIKDIVDGTIRTDSLAKCDSAIADDYKRTKLRGGELVISIRGTVGRVGHVPLSLRDGNITRELALIPLKDEMVCRRFLLSVLVSQSIQKRLIEDVRGIAQRGINLRDLRLLDVIQPSTDLQTRFASIVESIEQQKTRLKAHLAELDTLFASLQSRAFNGELVA